jgi:UDP-2,3-diacylglucosamine hydrolase
LITPAGGPARTLFISDLHLDPSRPGIVAKFERFLGDTAPGADALYILGDLFEYWVGDDGLELPFPAAIARTLAQAAGRMPVRFMHGNRDFLVARRFSEATGIELIDDPTVIDLYGTRTALLHGDTLCTDDVEYQKVRFQMRDPRWQQAVLTRPIAERVAIAQGMRAQSEGTKAGKDQEIMDVARAAVEQAFVDCDCAQMIHGHTHRPGRHEYIVDGVKRVRWVLPDWYEAGGYLEATPAGLRAVAA